MYAQEKKIASNYTVLNPVAQPKSLVKDQQMDRKGHSPPPLSWYQFPLNTLLCPDYAC